MTKPEPQRIVVLAARSTIGQAIANQLNQNGSRVSVIARDLEGVDSTDIDFHSECDLTDFDGLHKAISEASEAMGGLTGIVNCAGRMVLKPAHLIDRDTFADIIEANLTTAFATVRASAKCFAKSGGSVVLISSAAATLGMPNHELISAAKSGVEGLMRSAAASYASKGIRYNAVAPGLTDTQMTAAILQNASSRNVSESLHPLGRIGKPEEIASAVCWLLDPAQAWVTGQVIGVDGGLSRVQPRPKISAPRS